MKSDITRFASTGLAFLAALAFLLTTVPANHTEAEDAYFYARITESGRGAELFHRHHLLYLPVGRAIFSAARWMGYAGRALPVLIGFSAVAGAAATVCLWRLLPCGSGAMALGLLFSYGFWRYSATAEIYAPLAALCLGAFLCADRSERSRVWTFAAIGFGAAALLLHVAAAPAVLAAIPVLYLCRRRWRTALLHAGAVGLIVAAVYGVVLAGPGAVVYRDASVMRHGLFSPRAWLGAAAAAGHTVVSGNFIFALPSAAERIQSALPYHMLHEEVFMGARAPIWVRRTAPLTAVVTIVAGLAFLAVAARGARRQREGAKPAERATGLAAGAWLAGSSVMALLFEPANPEMWLPALPPLWLGLGRLWARGVPSRPRLWRRAPAVGAALLLLHNAVGGLAPVWSAEGDYARQKTSGVIERAGPNDWILTADSHGTVTYLQYYAAARVLDGRYIGVQEWRALMEERPPANVWVLGEFLEPPPAIRRRPAAMEQRRRELADMLAPNLIPTYQDKWVMTYLVRNPMPSPQSSSDSIR